ncbi:hypothetical protein [Methylobacterium nigriterrae]|uniref:hypothetical protein n=1 Tax=Methylobacterium nigriterrae TaxID=3127512 RepID=UPI00301388F9
MTRIPFLRMRVRILAALVAGLAVGLAMMAYDRARDAQWAVTPGQIADAQAHGRPGVEVAPGRFVDRPVPGEGAAWLPVKWLLLGAGAACAVLAGTGRRP